MIRLLTVFIISSLFFPSLSIAERYDRARLLLEKMSQSIHELNYRGLFSYEVGGALDNYKIVHQVRENIEYERLQKLNGKEKEILRSGFAMNCLSRGDLFFRGIDAHSDASLNTESKYFYHLTGKGRVADRNVLTIQILPKDAHRYGYIFSVDEETHFPLQMLMIDGKKKILERIQFIDLEVGVTFDDTELLPSSNRYTSVNNASEDCENFHKEGADTEDSNVQAVEQSHWDLGWMPAGYTFLSSHRTKSEDIMMSYTDGLGSFSVVVAPNRLFPAVEGRAQLGGTVAYVKQYQWEQALFNITVVGEIPMSTAHKIAVNVKRREPLLR